MINLPGSVDLPDEVAWIRYHLNGSPQIDFCIGPDQRRLVNPGDFNLEICTEKLIDGRNEILIEVLDINGILHRQTVVVNYASRTTWALPYSICWSEVKNLQDVVQVIDGRWEIREGKLHCVEAGYDRLVGMGDRLSWRDYQVSVPVTIHNVHPAALRFPSLGDWAGIVLRWQGHYDWSTDQPLRGWYPLGAICSSFWKHELQQRYLSLLGNNVQPIAMLRLDHGLQIGIPYWFKARVQSRIGSTSWYSLKVWKENDIEPSAWQLEGQGIPGELTCGSVLLAAHQCEVSFGNITIEPIH
jgi:hypothetical protein